MTISLYQHSRVWYLFPTTPFSSSWWNWLAPGYSDKRAETPETRPTDKLKNIMNIMKNNARAVVHLLKETHKDPATQCNSSQKVLCWCSGWSQCGNQGRKASKRLIRAAVGEKVYTAKKGGHTALLFGVENGCWASTGKGTLDLDGEGCLEPTISEDQVPTLVL